MKKALKMFRRNVFLDFFERDKARSRSQKECAHHWWSYSYSAKAKILIYVSIKKTYINDVHLGAQHCSSAIVYWFGKEILLQASACTKARAKELLDIRLGDFFDFYKSGPYGKSLERNVDLKQMQESLVCVFAPKLLVDRIAKKLKSIPKEKLLEIKERLFNRFAKLTKREMLRNAETPLTYDAFTAKIIRAQELKHCWVKHKTGKNTYNLFYASIKKPFKIPYWGIGGGLIIYRENEQELKSVFKPTVNQYFFAAQEALFDLVMSNKSLKLFSADEERKLIKQATYIFAPKSVLQKLEHPQD